MRLVRGLANEQAAVLLAGRANQPFVDVEDAWRRGGAQVSSLVRLAEADAFRPSIGLARREALWAIKALRDIPLPLFAAAEGQPAPETNDQAVALKAMTAGHEVVEDYGHVGLTLRRHPVSFLREELSADRILSCGEANRHPDRRRVKVAGLVLVRQRPGTAKGVTFITIEDETGVANLVVWADLYECQRRTVLTASMLVVEGRVQREGLVVHIVAEELTDLTDRLASIGERDGEFRRPRGGGDNFTGDSAPDPRDPAPLRVKSRNFH
jgi:error-prone DNA polymerase